MDPLKIPTRSATRSPEGRQVVEKIVHTLTVITLVALAVGGGILSTPAETAWAATFDVSRLDDPSPDGCAPGDCSLREAILDANALAGADTINLPAGTYSSTLAGAGEDAAATGDLDILDSVTIVGQGAGATLDAGSLGDRVFHVLGGNDLPVVTISGVTITGGGEDSGGGLYNLGGSVTLTNSAVSNNSASGNTGNGGGLYNVDGSLSITNSVLSGNSSLRTDPSSNLDYAGGGAIYNNSGGTVTVDGGSSITGNSAVPNYGGGIFNEGGVVTVTNGTISNNVSTVGGGIFNLEGSVTLSDSTVATNSEGGLYNYDGTMTLNVVTISDNVNGLSGGGGILNGGGTVDLSDSTITGNTAGSGGGMFNTQSLIGSGSPGTMTLTNSTVTGNSADSNTVDSKGGGIWNYAQNGEALLTLLGTTVSGNEAVNSAQGDDRGGGIFNGAYGQDDVATTTLIDSFVSSNEAMQGGGIYNDRGLVDASNSTIDHNTASESGGGFNTWRGTIVMNGSTIDGNVAGGHGGGLYNAEGLNPVDLTMSNSTVSNNTASGDGGGLYNRDFTGVIDNTVFSDNSAVGGGGLFVRYNPVTLSHSTLTGNSATGNGGGLSVLSGGIAEVANSTIDGNSATDGGGLYVDGATADVTHSTISGNSASSEGGGIYVSFNFYHDSKATLLNSTISGNSGSSGGGLYTRETLELAYSTVTDNSATSNGGGISVTSGARVTALNSIVAGQGLGSDCDMNGTSDSDGHNLESGVSCIFLSVGDLQNTDPLLLPLADNGGPTHTHALPVSSPAIDAGPPAGCTWDLDDDGVLEPLGDQRGIASIDMPGVGNEPPDQVCDIGAYEYVPLLVNANFESDLDGDGVPDSWLGANLGPNDVQNCVLPAHSGSCMFRVRANGNLKRLYQDLPQSGLAGDSYTLSLWSAAKNAKGGALVARVKFNYTDGTTEVFTSRLTKGTHNWQHFAVVATAAQDYDAISVRVASTLKSGRFAVDEVTLIQN